LTMKPSKSLTFSNSSKCKEQLKTRNFVT